MSRIRSIKPEMLADAVTAGLTDSGFRMFVGMILLADNFGRLRADTKYLAGQIWHRHRRHRCAAALREVAESGLVTLYDIHGQQYAEVRNWAKHQMIRKPGKPRIPGPPDTEETPSVRLLATCSAPVGQSVRSEGHLSTPTEHRGNRTAAENKGGEEEFSGSPPDAVGSPPTKSAWTKGPRDQGTKGGGCAGAGDPPDVDVGSADHPPAGEISCPVDLRLADHVASELQQSHQCSEDDLRAVEREFRAYWAGKLATRAGWASKLRRWTARLATADDLRGYAQRHKSGARSGVRRGGYQPIDPPEPGAEPPPWSRPTVFADDAGGAS